ncbi:MAG: four helix bundle protein [Spirosomataceae bacterium]
MESVEGKGQSIEEKGESTERKERFNQISIIMQNYKDLIVWKKSHELTLTVFHETTHFPKDEQFVLTSQLKRACLSIPLNIVEGSGRFTDADTVHFFQTSLGSTHETEYCLLLAKDLGYISNEKFIEMNSVVSEVKAMLITLIQKIRTRNSFNKKVKGLFVFLGGLF